MSNELSEESGGPNVGVAIDAAPQNTVPPVTEISAMGMHGMQEHIAPYQQSRRDGKTNRAAGSNTSTAFRGSIIDEEDERSEKIKGRRAWMTLVATITASITYQAGLNPPGGFWQADDSQGHRAGSPVLHDEHLLRYQIFYYCNAMAFVTSLAMIMVLVSDRLFASESKVLALGFTTCINVASLFGAYAAGSTLSSTSTIIFVVITCVFFVIVVYITELVSEICCFVMLVFSCNKVVQKRWWPIPNSVVEKARQKRVHRGGVLRRILRAYFCGQGAVGE